MPFWTGRGSTEDLATPGALAPGGGGGGGSGQGGGVTPSCQAGLRQRGRLGLQRESDNVASCIGSVVEKIRSPVGSNVGTRKCWHPVANSDKAASHKYVFHARRAFAFMSHHAVSEVCNYPQQT